MVSTTMKKNSVSNIHMALCRICLNKKQFLYRLFHEADVPTYGEMLNNCANVKVFSGDGLPDKICCSCSNILKSAYKFKQIAEKALMGLASALAILNSAGTLPENGEKGQLVRMQRPTLKGLSYRPSRLRLKNIHMLIQAGPLLENGEKGQLIHVQRPTVKGLSRGLSRPRRKNEIPSKKPIHKPREKDCCPVCGMLTFGIRKHMLTHAEKKPFQCEQCLRSFVAKSCYDVHMKKHKGIKDHICDICGAGFYSSKNLKRHRLIHQGERKYACTLCDKKFLLGHSLRRHQEIHAGYKPNKCTECLMSFNTKNQLRNHMLTHTGERPYFCKVCDVKFGYKVNLNNHVTKVHGINLRYKSVYTVTEEVIERESKAMDQAKIQADALVTLASQLQLQPVPEDQITTQIVFDDELNEF